MAEGDHYFISQMKSNSLSNVNMLKVNWKKTCTNRQCRICPFLLKAKNVYLYCYRQKISLQIQHHLQEFQLDLLYHMQTCMPKTICGSNQEYRNTKVLQALLQCQTQLKKTDAVGPTFLETRSQRNR